MSVEFIVMSLFLTFDSFIPIVEDCNPFQPSVAFDMETSQLICTANGFEMG